MKCFKGTIENVRDGWSKILDFSDGDYPESHQMSTMDVMMRLNSARSGLNILI